MDEKRAIEKATAEAFIRMYNAEKGTSYVITQFSDAPDVHCEDTNGNILCLEITMTEDLDGDIQAALGRSDHKDIEYMREHLRDIPVSCLQGDVLDMLVSRIRPKLMKDYGVQVALVIRNTSGIDWSWEKIMDELKSRIRDLRNPFDRGIWIVSRSKDTLVRLL